jgi:hypothetical protein
MPHLTHHDEYTHKGRRARLQNLIIILVDGANAAKALENKEMPNHLIFSSLTMSFQSPCAYWNI